MKRGTSSDAPLFEEFSYENVYNKKGMFVKAFPTFTIVSISIKYGENMSIFKNISKFNRIFFINILYF